MSCRTTERVQRLVSVCVLALFVLVNAAAGVISLIPILLIVSGLSAYAQSPQTALIKGRVTDPSTAVMPGIVVEVRGTAQTGRAVTDRTGAYSIAVKPGAYSVASLFVNVSYGF